MRLQNFLPLLVLLGCTKAKTDSPASSSSANAPVEAETKSTPTETAENNAAPNYAGVYEYGKDIEKEPVGQLTVFKEANGTYLFYLDVSTGAPSYNMGSLYGRLTVKDGKATYSNQLEYTDKPCTLDFTVAGETIKVASRKDTDCGFGNGVYADGDFKRTKTTQPDHFVNGEGTKVYFKNTTPEDYGK
jgi:hypothetical protein